MGMAADTLERLTGVKPKEATGPAPQFDIDPEDNGMAAETLRRALGKQRQAVSFSDRFDPADEKSSNGGLTEAQLRNSAAKPDQRGFNWSRTISDIGPELDKERQSIEADAAALGRRGEMGTLEGLKTTGKAALIPLRVASAPIVAAARSIGGHALANAEHAAGTVISPEIAANDDPEKMYQTARGDVDTALSAARPAGSPIKVPAVGSAGPYEVAAGSPVYKWRPPAKIPPASADELKAAAKSNYEHPELTDLQVKSEAMRDFAGRSESVLANEHGVDENLAPKTTAILRKAQSVPDGAMVTGRNIISLRRSLQHAAASPDPTERFAATSAIDHLDGWLPTIEKDSVISGNPEAASARLEQGNKDYSALKHSELIDNKLLRAELRSASAHSGMGPTNAVRQRMADILLNPKEQRGYTAGELGQMEQIVRGTGPRNVLRGVSNALGGGGGLGSTLLGTVTLGAAPAIGIGLRALSNRLTINQAEKLSGLIRSRPELSTSAEKFDAAAEAFGKARNARTVAGINIAARNLANNLNSAGFNIGVSDILKALQSPSSGKAEEQQ